MTTLEVRDAVTQDLEHLEHVFRTSFNAPPWNDGWSALAVHERLDDLLSTRHFRGAVALVDSEVVGMVLGQKERWVDAYHFNLIEMCVLPNLQRRGIGRALLQHLFETLEREGVHKVYLLTAPSGPAAAFYSKHGFYASRGRVVLARSLDRQ